MNDSVVIIVAVVCFFSMMRTEMECIDVILHGREVASSRDLMSEIIMLAGTVQTLAYVFG